MDAVEWAAISAVASAIAAIAASFNAFIQRRSTDARDCLEIVKQLAEVQRKANTAQGEDRNREILEVLNLFETVALLFNKGSLGPASEYIVREALIDGWVRLGADPGMREFVHGSITGPTTFEQLVKFTRRFRRQIASLAEKSAASL